MDSPEIIQAGLLQRIAAHDPEAVGTLFDLQSPSLYAFITRIVVDESDAGDILQKVFSRVWSDAASYNALLLPPSIWLIGLARKLAVGHLKPDGSDHPSPDESLREYSGITDGVLQLSPQQWALIEFAYFRGYTLSRLGQVFGLPPDTVRSELCSGVLALRAYAYNGVQQAPMMSHYLDKLAMLNSVGALDGEDLDEFKRLSPNVTIEAQQQIASYERGASLIALSGSKQRMPPVPIKEQFMKHIHELLSTKPPSQ